jgi:NADP-dependent 3-hydroxy acid dehydrogenase YdfG
MPSVILEENTMDIKNKIAVVTGASKGIGKSIALSLAEAGADVAISARSTDLLNDVAKEIEKMGRRVFVFTGDMSNENDIKEFVKESVAKLGGIDILINNAGLGHFYPIEKMPTDKWDEMFNLNMRGLFIITRESLPFLKKSDESIVINISSLAGKNSFPTGGGYAATKHALMAFSRCLMLEERKNGVRVLAICPGSVDTHFDAHFDRDKQDMKLTKKEKAMQPEDIAAAILPMIQMPQRTMISEIDIRPSNP